MGENNTVIQEAVIGEPEEISASADTEETLNLSDGEKIIINLLCEFLKAGNHKTELDLNLVTEAIFKDQLWAIAVEHPGLRLNEETPKDVDETFDILNLWDLIETKVARLSDADRERLAKELPVWGENPKFLGFDGNAEARWLGTARFIVNTLGRFAVFQGRELNSHVRALDSYRRMLKKANEIGFFERANQIGIDELKAVLAAQPSPN